MPVDILIVALPVSAETRVLQLIKKLWVLPVDIRLAAQASKLRFRPRAYSFAGTVPLIDIVDKPITDWDVVVKWLFDKSVAALALLALAPVMALVGAGDQARQQGPGAVPPEALRLQQRADRGVQVPLHVRRPGRRQCGQAGDQGRSARHRASAASSARPASTSCRSSSTCCAASCRSSARARTPCRPRPPTSSIDDVVDGYFARHKVKPGITGWAQINGWRGETDTPEKIQKRVEHDLYYIDNWSRAARPLHPVQDAVRAAAAARTRTEAGHP